MVKREMQKEQTRRKLLISAAKCFAEKGFDGCSVSDIAREAGMSQGSLYVHFTSKEDLFKCMIRQEHGEGAAKMRRAAEEAPSLDAVMDILAQCIRDVGFPIDHRLWTEILAVAARNETIRIAFLESDRLMRDAFIDLLKKASKAGEVDKKLDFEAVSVWIYALVDGLIARTADDSHFDFKSHWKTFDRLVRRALGVPDKPRKK